MAREEPNNVPQITELHKFKKLAPAIHVFNSIVLDDSTRWYAEKICPAYFATRTEYDQYIKKINGNKPMDFGTIRKNILNHKYKSSSKLFHDMELVFKNAMAYNNKGNQWHEPARRLYTILQFMKTQSVIKKEQFIPAMNNCKTCPQCNNIMLPTKTITTRRCSQCSTNISGQRMDCFICHNHSDQSHSFCIKCVQKKCQKCFNWHAGKRCDTKKKGSNGTNKRSRTKARDDNNWGLTQINLQVPPKPYNIQTVTSFDKVECNPTFNARIETMIKQIKAHDTEMHFFKKVDHPLYAQLVKNPIHFGQILKRINKNKYDTMGEIKRDIDLLWNNCYTFNGPPNADDKTNASAFANFAHDLQWALDEYIKQFETNLTKQNWIGSKSTGSSSVHSSPKVSKKSSKHKEKIKNESKKKKKHKHKHKKNHDNGFDDTHNTHTNHPSSTHKKSLKSKKQLTSITVRTVKATASTPHTLKPNKTHLPSKKKHTNKQSLTPNQPANTAHNVATPTLTNTINNNKQITIDDDDSSSSSTDHEDHVDNQTTNKINVKELVARNNSIWEMSPAPAASIEPIHAMHHKKKKKKKKRNRSSYASGSEDEIEFGNNDNIEAPPAKKRKIAISDPSPASVRSQLSPDQIRSDHSRVYTSPTTTTTLSPSRDATSKQQSTTSPTNTSPSPQPPHVLVPKTSHPKSVPHASQFLEPSQDQDVDGDTQASQPPPYCNNKDKTTWSTSECAEWVGSLGDAYKQYTKSFVYHSIDGELLDDLDDDLLKEIIDSGLHRRKITLAWRKLQTE
eukprot:876412_1